jgi:DNA-directed RNA polymerase specialized sigma24 family protein
MAGQSPALKDLRARLHAIEAALAELRQERDAVRAAIDAERAQAADEAKKAEAGQRMNVLARWEQGMTSVEIAAAMSIPKSTVERFIGEYRKAEGVTVRRGRVLKERRQLRD